MTFRTYNAPVSIGFDFSITPMVKRLVIANVAAFALAILAGAAGWGDAVRSLLMLTPVRVTQQLALWQLATYMFLHAGFWHILFNMFALWMFGRDLEQTWGPRRFLFYYFLTGIGAGLTVVLLSPFSPDATVGASGAIYGILLAYGLLFPNRIILVPIFFFFFFPVPAKILVAILGGIAFLSALSSPGDTISHVAHLGGLVAGFLYLRGRPYYFHLRNQYYRWRRLRLQRQFQAYMSRQERKERDSGRWVN